MTTAENTRSWITSSILLVGMLLAGVVPGQISAQDVDSRWLPWLGCWEATDGDAESPMLCFRPSSDAQGVELTTWSGGEVISTETILADGLSKNAEREGCTGYEEARFSEWGGRVYLKADYVCEEGGQRTATGLMAMINPMEWVDVKVIHSAGQRVPWTLRYRLARASRVAELGMEDVVAPRAMAVKGARIAASRKLTVDDIVEATRAVDPEAVEALVVERGDPFRVDAEMLLALSDAGVPESVIDLVVAVSFPDRYAVKPGAVQEVARDRSDMAYPMGYGRSYRYGFFSPFYDPYYYGYGGYGYSPYAFGGYGYGGYGYGGYGGYYRPTTIVVTPRESGPTQRGRVVRGQGYTRSGGSSYSGSGGTSRSGSSGTVSSSGGTSRGTSSGSSGRTAKPRGGGGGGL